MRFAFPSLIGQTQQTKDKCVRKINILRKPVKSARRIKNGVRTDENGIVQAENRTGEAQGPRSKPSVDY
jgi:hypothetical protein